ncbi:rhomboid family intramembrane serine protease [Bartonella sp. HY406]|uniref:rhomboid family intramembrane serine protease n=1 Tax=Bartonella sp. HY406 TaxID=2979331 RepID=UPI0021C8E421|nr:rhomboid family intramembrane serine protease [Bartonella sp. HY406]UXN04431.1 rhomboid family intramembrane serine protease [Bartonella sp. HY406]
MQPNNIHPFRNREPRLNIPTVVVVFVVINIAVFIWQDYILDWNEQNYFIVRFAFIPLVFGSEQTLEVLLTPVTSSFLHASWSHLGMNMLFMVVFGSPLARRMGVGGFIVFWIFTSAAGALFYYVLNTDSPIPVVGASGVVSAMLGAIARFGYGRSFFHPSLYGDVLPIRIAIRSRDIVTIMGFWLASNLLYGVTASWGGGAIAWQAHIGGLLAGFLAIGLFIPPRKK